MPIVDSFQPGNFVLPGAYVVEEAAAPPTPTGPQSDLIGVVGPANWGTPNVPMPFAIGANAGEALSTFGNGTTLPHSLVGAAVVGAAPEGTNFVGARVTDGSDEPAGITINDGTGFATDTLTVGGAFAAGANLSVTFTPVVGPPIVVTYQTQLSDATLAGVAASLCAAINASLAVVGGNAFLQPATVTGAVISLKALVTGAGQNAIAVATTGAGVTLTAGSATFANGSSAGVLITLTAVSTGSYPNAGVGNAFARVDLQSGSMAANPVLRVTVGFPGTTPAVYGNIVAYPTGGGAYAAATFIANAVAALNGTNAGTVANPYFAATAGSSTSQPLLATLFYATGGADGATNITTAVLLGTDGNTRTGMYALRKQIPGGTLLISGLNDLSAATTISAFCQSESIPCALIGVGPAGTTTAQAVAGLQNYAVRSRYIIPVIDYEYAYDNIASAQRLVAPMGKVAGIIASTAAYKSPANKPVKGAQNILGTERTMAPALPVGDGEAGERVANGIMWLANPIPRGNVFGLPHDYASDGSHIADTRMMCVIALGLEQVLGQFVGEMQSTDQKDDVRSRAQAACSAYLEQFVAPVRMIDSFSDICDTTNNTPTTESQGFLNDNASVKTLNGVEFAVADLMVDGTVQVSATPT